VAQAELSLVVAGITRARLQQVIHDEQTRAGCEFLVESHHVITGVVVVVSTQTTQVALQHAQWRHLTHTHTDRQTYLAYSSIISLHLTIVGSKIPTSQFSDYNKLGLDRLTFNHAINRQN